MCNGSPRLGHVELHEADPGEEERKKGGKEGVVIPLKVDRSRITKQ